ncbi:hypothetical protein N7471_012341 [Penicillium samsonianum]|uniref:uncharacterized protein n=1 Tax=Penicillium samsonianum TaxID=1882272 RepID=UPI002548FE79|nr:uncharacterized protein N7471_012341 [Penicillium samsonianum]KAJ6125024.1 hypothetical protein N7471_012341 [Penicillium samsonianum]
MAIHHLGILDDLARDLKVSSNGLENARRLAKGYEDLVVVLIEPTNKAEEVHYDEMLAASETLLCVNETLQFASGGQRNIENTIILDIRAFRSDSIRTSQISNDRTRDDELAYGNFERIMSLLRPRVVVACQCATTEANNQFVQGLCSSIKRAGDICFQQLPNGHQCLLVKSFHPMGYKRSKDCALKRVMLEYLFDATFIIALNALAGDRISGVGLKNLQNCAQDGPAPIFSPEEIYISYQWMSGRNAASGKLLKHLQYIGN